MSPGASELWKRLEAAGLPDVYSLLGEGNVRPYDWEKMAAALPEEPQALWRFLMLGSRLAPSRALELLGPKVLGFLREHRLCRAIQNHLTLGPLALFSFRGATFFAERIPLTPGYFSDDHRALATLVPRQARGAWLNLYPGSGAAALASASRPEVEVAFAEGPVNRGLIRANLELNGASAKPRFLARDAMLKSRPFDLIAASPPCGVEVTGGRLPAWMAAGREGRHGLFRVLSLAEKLLAPDGTVVITFLFYSSPDSKKMEEQLRAILEKSPLDWRLTVCSKHFLEPGAPVFNALFNAQTGGKPQGANEILKKVLRHLHRKKLGAVYLIKGQLFGRRPPLQRELVDYSEMFYGAWVF